MRRISIAGVLLVFAASLGYCEARARQLNSAFQKVVVGDAERDVIAKMGRPHQFSKAVGITIRISEGASSDARESTFTSPLGPLLMRLGRSPSMRME